MAQRDVQTDLALGQGLFYLVTGRVHPEIRFLGAASAVALATIDTVYVAQRRISPVYLLDAILEVVLLGGWASSRRGL